MGILAVLVGWLAWGRAALQRWRGVRPIELRAPRLPVTTVDADFTGLSADESEQGRYATAYAYSYSDHPERITLEGAKSTLHSPRGRVCDRVLKLGAQSGCNFDITIVVADRDWSGSEVDVELIGQTESRAKVRWRGLVPVEPYSQRPWAAWI